NYEVESVSGNCHYKLGKRPNSANAWGPWDPEKYTVEDSAFGFIKMKNGATIILESSWAINLANPREATVTLAGTEAGVDFLDGMRVNGEEFSKLYLKKIDLSAGGVAFYEGVDDGDPSALDMAQWIDAIINDKEPCVKPEQALVVSEILEAIYTSYRTGKTVYFD
ncbi:MAG: gfo/Idh/MocA family oxidoreductase, partial [Clostridia bacterium]|nr:gfo/Idh/MocA family oxidoreductase [Clostridia bacterium]